jgi:hypothetical protein
MKKLNTLTTQLGTAIPSTNLLPYWQSSGKGSFLPGFNPAATGLTNAWCGPSVCGMSAELAGNLVQDP